MYFLWTSKLTCWFVCFPTEKSTFLKSFMFASVSFVFVVAQFWFQTHFCNIYWLWIPNSAECLASNHLNPKCPEMIDDIINWIWLLFVVVLMGVIFTKSVRLTAALCCGTLQGHRRNKSRLKMGFITHLEAPPLTLKHLQWHSKSRSVPFSLCKDCDTSVCGQIIHVD